VGSLARGVLHTFRIGAVSRATSTQAASEVTSCCMSSCQMLPSRPAPPPKNTRTQKAKSKAKQTKITTRASSSVSTGIG